MSTLLEKMLSSGSAKNTAVLSASSFFNVKDTIPTDLPILNVAFSGSVDGGLLPGLTVIAGVSKTFKSMLSLYSMKAYLDKYPDAIALFYDSEFGITPEYIAGFQIDIDRVVHIPITDVEELKFDIVQKLKEIGKKDKVFILIDSLGNLASKKEMDDAEEEKSVGDMSRAKAIKSLFRIITPSLTTKNIPCIVVNHVYMTMEKYARAIVSGGQGVIYSANTIFVITKAQEKEGTEVVGWNFTINIEKSRYVKEKSKLTFKVLYDGFIQKYSSLFDLALEAGFLVKPKVGWYNKVNQETGELSEQSYRKGDLENNAEYFDELMKNKTFKEFVENKFKLGSLNTENPVDSEE